MSRCRLRVSGLALVVGPIAMMTVNAYAFVIDEDPFEERSLKLGGALRAYELWLSGGPLAALPAAADDDPAAISVVSVRPELEWRTADVDVVVHEESTTVSSTLASNGLDGVVPIGGGSVSLWLPLQWSTLDGARLQLDSRIDWAYARMSFDSALVTVGRQPVSIGVGQLWTPQDLLAPFSPLQMNTEYKPGVDGVRLDWSPSQTLTIAAIAVVGGRDPHDELRVHHAGSAAIVRGEWSSQTVRLGVQAGDVHSDVVGGIDFFVDLGHGVDLHGAGTLTVPSRTARRPHGRRAFNRAVLGANINASDWTFTSELYFNGSGATGPSTYVAELAAPRFVSGEAPNLGRAYGGLVTDWSVHPLFHAQLALIANLQDASALIAPALDYSFATNAQLVAGAFIAAGKRPTYGFDRVVAHSEYGLYPDIYHLDLKCYF